MRATVSADLLATIFSPYSPLHDGAVLVRGDEIVGAGCILPLTQNPVSDRSLGTRHRAALGLSEETDALVLVVSEESAIVSLARGGRAAARAQPGAGGRPARGTACRPGARAGIRSHAMSAGGPAPYRAAALVTAAVLAGYVLTLAPSVTFWDAGEFIAAARTLGIPHPPGTPLFVLIAHVWAMLVPVGEFAVRTNFLSALFSAAGAGCFFLVAHESLRDFGPRLRLAGAASGALLGGFTFTNWQNSNETEVYAVATFTIAAMTWLALLWRRRRGEPKSGRLLLLVVYLAGISVGNHLLALLAGPAIVAFLVAALRAEPAADRRSAPRGVGTGGGGGRRVGAADRHRAGQHHAGGARGALLHRGRRACRARRRRTLCPGRARHSRQSRSLHTSTCTFAPRSTRRSTRQLPLRSTRCSR